MRWTVWLVLALVLVSQISGDDNQILYLKQQLLDLHQARKAALERKDAGAATQLAAKIETVEYLLARLATEKAGSTSEPEATSEVFAVEEAYEGNLWELLEDISETAHLRLVHSRKPGDISIYVAPGKYDAEALTRACALSAGLELEIVEPGHVLVILSAGS